MKHIHTFEDFLNEEINEKAGQQQPPITFADLSISNAYPYRDGKGLLLPLGESNGANLILDFDQSLGGYTKSDFIARLKKYKEKMIAEFPGIEDALVHFFQYGGPEVTVVIDHMPLLMIRRDKLGIDRHR